MPQPTAQHDLTVLGAQVAGSEVILADQALAFVAALNRNFKPQRDRLLGLRVQRQAQFDTGALPDFLQETAEIRQAEWQVAPIPADLLDRRVEITGPVDRKMIINALNSGAKVFMADFEDSNAPTWANQIEGQINLFDAVRRTITLQTADKTYRLVEQPATLMVRPRGWHLPEAHVTQDGTALVGALFDFGLYFFHNAKTLLERGSGPYFYLPKMQSHLEARLWNDVFVFSQRYLGLPNGTIRATVLIETLPAAFEMDEILWELRDHSAGLNCGRWDYIFSTIKTLKTHADRVMPDRKDIAMTQPNMRAYTRRLIQTCHRRGIHAMGGMAAQIPIKNDAIANAAAVEKVRTDKRREVTDGHDGTWVAHPGLIALAQAEFDAVMPGPNQIDRCDDDHVYTAQELLAKPVGERTEHGLRENLRVGVQYLQAWLQGNGCVPLYNLMEDAATAEISRAQAWQWLHHQAQLDDGRVVDAALFQQVLASEMALLRTQLGDHRWQAGHYDRAAQLFAEGSTAPQLADFLTTTLYPHLVVV